MGFFNLIFIFVFFFKSWRAETGEEKKEKKRGEGKRGKERRGSQGKRGEERMKLHV